MSSIQNKRVLCVGGAGSIGAELVRQLCVDNKVYVFDNDETRTYDLAEELTQQGYWVHYHIGDIRDKETVKDVFSDFKPEIIINAAALKHVSPSQIYPREYVLTNILGNLNLIEEAKKWECVEKFVFISTDKVVNDDKSVMGATKMCSETITIALGFTSVRFGNVLSSRGSLLEIWDRQFKAGQPLTITDPDMTRYFMSIPDACKLVIKALVDAVGGSIYLIDMGEKKRIIDFKEELYPGYPFKIIGKRPGEVLTEDIMSSDEKARAVKKDEFYVIK